MKKLNNLLILLMLCISIMLITGCQDEILSDDSLQVVSGQTRATTPYEFDWENSDRMPTPPGQSQIPSPWVGQGSLASTYGLDILNDRKASDGWVLMYNSFDPTSPGPLVNPYFIIYNKFRGLMRIFLYTTTQFYSPSSYLEDGISIISNHNTSLLNYLGQTYIDMDKPIKSYSQIQPKPADGSYPLASNRWYMMQYELAYDPNLETIPYEQIQLNWVLSSCNVTEIKGWGGTKGEINGTIGSSSTHNSNTVSNLKKLGTTTGTGVLAGIGVNFLKNNTENAETGKNKLNVPNEVFKSLSRGVSAALSAATGNIPGTIIDLLSGVFGGSSSEPTAASFNIAAQIELEGTAADSGSFPSMPLSFWVPGTNISSSTVGNVPLYNKNLGVVGFSKPINDYLPVRRNQGDTNIYEDPWNGEMLECLEMFLIFDTPKDYSDYLYINPEVESKAVVTVKSQTVYVVYEQNGHTTTLHNPKSIKWEEWYPRPEHDYTPLSEPILIGHGVRFEIEVKPRNGSPSSLIYKTFVIK